MVAEASAPLSVFASSFLVERAGPVGLGRGRRGRRSPPSAVMPHPNSRRYPASASRARCMARPCSTSTTSRSGPRSCGTTAARLPNVWSSKRRVPDLEQRTGNLAMPGFTAPKMLWVAAHEPEVATATKRVLLPKDYVRLRLSGEAVLRDVRRLGNAVARRRAAALGRRPPRGDRPDRDRDAAARRRLGDLGVPFARDRPGLGPRGAHHSDRRRRRRQRRLGDRRRRHGAGSGVRFARHVRRHLFGHRPIRQPARAHAARLLPRAASSLARHGGHAVGRLLARLDRRAPRPRARHRRADRRRGGLRPIEERGRVRADLPALSQRRADAAQRRRGDGHVRRA